MNSFAYIAGSMAGGMLANTGYENRKEIVLEMRDGAGIEAIMLVLLSYPPLFRYMLITKPGM